MYRLPPIFAAEPPFCHASHPRGFLRLREACGGNEKELYKTSSFLL
ncbi:hypothetical protein U722_14975 [Bacillus amyloliquefaciens LFB112]|nr:hypothetical protein U722_14975 [Bacillus amyloliquefaciens LFB112]